MHEDDVATLIQKYSEIENDILTLFNYVTDRNSHVSQRKLYTLPI